MKKFFIAFLLFICFCFAVQYSLRIKSLGTDFAYLVPDYETDLYNDPNLIGEKLAGISYEPGLSSPLIMRVLTKRFGWFGNYWAKHWNNILANYVPINITSITVNDLWMLDLRGKLPKLLAYDVENLRNDFSYYKKRVYFNDNDYDTIRTIKYLCSSSGAFRIGKYFKIIHRICVGIHGYYRNYIHYGSDVEEIDQWLFISTGRIGLYYRNAASANKFSSFYLTIGGPVTSADIDGLPYSVFSHLYADEMQQTFFARTLIAQMGWAKGISIDENGFIAIGMRDVLLYQRTNTPDTFFIYPITELRGLRNTLSFPVALEYHIGRVALRAGTRLYYTFKGDKEWNSDSTITCYNEHQLHFDYSFGLSWRPHDNFIIDVYNTNYLAELDNWAIYLKYVH